MRISEVQKKIILTNVRERIHFSLYHEESMERTLSMLNKARLLYECSDEKREELKKITSEITDTYFENGINYAEFCRRVFQHYPMYKDDYVFNIYLFQAYRRLFCKYLHELDRQSQTLKKLALIYKSRYR